MTKKLSLDFVVPLAVVALFGMANLFALFSRLDNRIYDIFLHVKPEVPQDKSILIIKVDDTSIAKVGSWPWSRSVMADGLITMKEFDAVYAVFDIEYVNPSPLGVDASYLRHQIPRLFNDEFDTLGQNTTDLFQAIKSGRISASEAGDYIQQLAGLTEDSKKLLLGKVQAIARDNDAYLGQAAWFFQNAFFTINYGVEKSDIPSDYEQWILEHDSLKNVELKGSYGHEVPGLQPAIQPILAKGAGAGFPHVLVDVDGVRRRIELVVRYGDKYLGQLVFAPLLHYLGDPKVELSGRQIVLRGAKIPGHPPGDISIPLNTKGEFLLNWPKRTFDSSFRQLSYYYLVRYGEQEDQLVELLRGMADANYFSFVPDGAKFLEPYDKADSIKMQVLSGGSPDLIPSYRELRAGFFDNVGRFLDGDAQKQILAQIDGALAKRGVSADQHAQLTSLRADVVSKFDDTRKIYAAYMESRKALSRDLAGSFCIIGASATSTTDFGVNPFDGAYPNVGTHATVANSILSGRYVEELPLWYSTVLTAILGLGLFLIIRRRSPLESILIGFGFILVSVCGTVALFVLTGIFLAVTTPLLTLLVIFAFLTIFRFLSEAREKSFIRNAFGRYLSGDVINELIANPDMLSLGGQQRELTAMFTDVKGFSTFSEQMSPSDLVGLLNKYLTAMSDIVMAERGTIDKYEGDAIISFFGAPVSFEDHAARACAAALRMKATEAVINERFTAEGIATSPLLTRIGINTGQMVVGNMGTENKMDYTIMGNSVNLASRLEGVNKQYNTWILVSEATRLASGSGFLFRKLDRVRVVGIQQPVRLFELVAVQGSEDATVRETVEHFHSALEVFEGKDWKGAQRGFEEILAAHPEDGPSKVYLKRCEEYGKTPPAATWDGVFSLTSK